MNMEEVMLDYNEFLKVMNCDEILRDFTLSIKGEGKKLYRNEKEIKYLKPGESILRYNDNENKFETKYIKMSHFSFDGREVYIELYNNYELENLYRNYLDYEFESVEYSENGDITFYPLEGIDINDVKKNGFKLEHHISYDVLSYEEFLKNLKNV